MATNTFDILPISVSSTQTIPASANGTGTVTTNGIAVVGVGTLFKSEMPVGSWLYKTSTNELRKVIQVESNVLAYLEEPFAAVMASIAPAIIISTKVSVKQYTLTALVANGQMVDNTGTGVTNLIVGQPKTFSKTGNDRSGTEDLLKPIIVIPGGGGTVEVDIVY